MAYLFDANVFIQAKNLHYGFSFCPAFWDWIVRENRAGKVFSVEKVRDEILEGEDELAQWAAQYKDSLFLALGASVLPAMRRISAWVSSQPYTPAAVSMFLQDPDYYLVAQALDGGHVVVTHEKPEASIKRVKIPQRLRRSRGSVHEPLRDAAAGAGTVRAGRFTTMILQRCARGLTGADQKELGHGG